MAGGRVWIIFNFDENDRIWKLAPDLFARFEKQADKRWITLDEFQYG